MKKCFLILFLFISFQHPTLTGKVVGVKDGDTVEILSNGKHIVIRLMGIDCPEKRQAFGQKAKQFTSDLCFNKEVRVISHGKDRYGRILGDIYLLDGVFVNKEIIQEGFAWHYKKYSSDTIFSNLEKSAREKRIGIWSGNPIPPWDFRKIKKNDAKK
jgi:micrococcal nuclease